MAETENSDVVVVQNQTLAEASDDIIASAERRIANIQRIIELSLRITNENDWVDQSGKPYMTASGAEKVARLFAVSWKDIKSEKIQTQDEKGPFYFYQVSGVFWLKSDSILAIGTCSSKDQFFAKKKEVNPETGETQTVLKPLSDVDETNIMKAAYSNMVANGVTRLLGLRNMTWEQLTKSNINKEKVASVKYASGGAGGGKISEPQRKRLFAISRGKKSDEEIKSYLKQNFNIEHTGDINRSDYDVICQWVEGKAA